MKDSELKKLVQQEIATCLGTLTWDVAELKRNMIENKHSLARIESGLFGDKELSVTGLAEKIEYSYNYAKRNIDSKIVERGEDAINNFNRDLDSFLRDHGFASMARVGSVGRAIEVFKKELEIYKRKGQTPLKRGGH